MIIEQIFEFELSGMACLVAHAVVIAVHIYPPVTGQHQTQNIGRFALFSSQCYFVVEKIRTCLRVSSNPMLL